MELAKKECAFQFKTVSAYVKQKMLLTILYKKIQSITVTEMARLLGVSKMSVTRCFNEIEAFHPEMPVAVIQVMGYTYLYEDTDELVIDPLSAILSLTKEELNDPRIEGAVEEILEEFIYAGT